MMEIEKETNTTIPRHSLWRLYLLLVFTLGVYFFFWLYGQLKHQYVHGRIKGRPLVWVLVSWIPLVDLYICYFLARKIYDEIDRPGKAEPWLIAISLSLMGNASLFIEMNYLWMAVASLVIPLPVVWLQFRINRALAADDAIPATFTTRQWYALTVGAIVVLTYALSVRYDVNVPATGITRHAVGSVITGPAGFYSVQLPDGNWKKVPNGTIQKETDMELIDAKNGIKAWVYVLEGSDADLVDQVTWRRKEIIGKSRVLDLDEKRVLLADYDDAVSSIARFELEKPKGGKVYWWIRTVEAGDRLVELLVRTQNEKSGDSASLLSDSLKLVNDGEQ